VWRPLERSLDRPLDRARPVQAPWAALAIGTNVAIRVVVVITTLSTFWSGPFFDADVQRFSALSVAPGIPYRDHAVEYAPVELGVIRAIGNSDTRATGTRLVILCFLLDLLAFAGMWSGWGRRTAITYLWLGVPLLVLRYVRMWYLPVALSVWGFALLWKRRPNLGGVVAALAVFAKLWPIAWLLLSSLERVVVLLRSCSPAWSVASAGCSRGHRRHPTGADVPVRDRLGDREHGRQHRLVVRRGRASMGSGCGSCRLVGGPHVATGGGARGPPRRHLVEGTRVGPEDLDGVPSLVAVCAVLACSPVFSLQYAGWLTPWAAIASRDSRRTPIASAWAIVALTAGMTVALWHYADSLGGLGAVMLLARNGVCLFLPVWFLARGQPAVADAKDEALQLHRSP
jgi:hypothetical protein